MKLKGKVIKLPDNVNTDLIISGRYKFSITDMKELSRHIMEDLDPNFLERIIPGESIIVAGNNFGLGSSREQAPLVIKEAGIIAVLAKSFARIFYRNSFNIGLPLLELETKDIRENDRLEIDFDKGSVKAMGKKLLLKTQPLPQFMQELLKNRGIIKYIKKHKGLF
jgi:3-isopropylmalate/(R)-2-methylmalate dehydratase small subunit